MIFNGRKWYEDSEVLGSFKGRERDNGKRMCEMEWTSSFKTAGGSTIETSSHFTLVVEPFEMSE